MPDIHVTLLGRFAMTIGSLEENLTARTCV
jgi:hypothetical protein